MQHPQATPGHAEARNIGGRVAMEWKIFGDPGFCETEGRVGFWEIRRVGNGQGAVFLAPTGTPSYLATQIGIFGSPAEARLAVAAYERVGRAGTVDEQLAAAGFVERGTVEGGRTYVGPSPNGSLALVIREADGGGLTLAHHPLVGVRWSTVASVTKAAALPGSPGIAQDVSAALVLADARLRTRASHARPLADGQETPFVEALAAQDTAREPLEPR